MTVVQSFRESIGNCGVVTNPLFVHGRNSDTALAAAKEQNIGTLVYCEPITKTTGTEDSTKLNSVVIGFLTQDEPDSDSDETLNESETLSMEEKVANMEAEAEAWINYYLDNYMYRISGTYSIEPVFRIKNVMTGVLLRFSLIEPKGC